MLQAQPYMLQLTVQPMSQLTNLPIMLQLKVRAQPLIQLKKVHFIIFKIY